MSAGPPRSRARAAAFAGLAIACGAGSASLAAGYRDEVEGGLGETRPVVVVERPLDAGEALSPRRLERGLSVREIPERFVPPDALADPGDALGGRPRAAVPAGSYLLASHLGQARRRSGRLAPGQRSIEVAVSAAGSLTGTGGGVRVDVLAAEEPGTTSNPRVRVLARAVPLLGVRRNTSAEAPESGWVATLALDRAASLRVIEAENYAREVRLLPR